VEQEEKAFHPVELVYVYFGRVVVKVARVATAKLMKEETVPCACVLLSPLRFSLSLSLSL